MCPCCSGIPNNSKPHGREPGRFGSALRATSHLPPALVPSPAVAYGHSCFQCKSKSPPPRAGASWRPSLRAPSDTSGSCRKRSRTSLSGASGSHSNLRIRTWSSAGSPPAGSRFITPFWRCHRDIVPIFATCPSATSRLVQQESKGNSVGHASTPPLRGPPPLQAGFSKQYGKHCLHGALQLEIPRQNNGIRASPGVPSVVAAAVACPRASTVRRQTAKLAAKRYLPILAPSTHFTQGPGCSRDIKVSVEISLSDVNNCCHTIGDRAHLHRPTHVERLILIVGHTSRISVRGLTLASFARVGYRKLPRPSKRS